jgi:outer membrane protein OmpA-like peptidoglycan-associated protein
MGPAQLNPWSAFSDLLFLLFLTMALTAAAVVGWAVQAEARLSGCGAAEEFMLGFAKCLEIEVETSEETCKISITESKLRFNENSTSLNGVSAAFADRLATCLVEALQHAKQRGRLDAIDVVTIDGYTDCKGNERSNLKLGALRAGEIFDHVLRVIEDRGVSVAERADLLGKVAIRSFGRQRPDPESPCAKDPELGRFADFAGDRRVEISVESRLRSP